MGYGNRLRHIQVRHAPRLLPAGQSRRTMVHGLVMHLRGCRCLSTSACEPRTPSESFGAEKSPPDTLTAGFPAVEDRIFSKSPSQVKLPQLLYQDSVLLPRLLVAPCACANRQH